MAKKYPSHKFDPKEYTTIFPKLSDEEIKERDRVYLWEQIYSEAKTNSALDDMLKEVETFYFLLKE